MTKSDVFICKLSDDEYWAYPSPFVAHAAGQEIRFRNLTNDEIEIDFGKAPLNPNKLPLGAKGARAVTVTAGALPDLYEYQAVAMVPPAPTAKAGGKPLVAVRVKGGSSPKIIIDT